MKHIKIIILGDSNVGKSSLLLQMTERQVSANTCSTIGVDYRTINFNNNLQLRIWDTAGQENLRTLVRHYYRQADAILFVYDITNYESLEGLNYWIREVEKYCPELSKNRMLIVGNKSDIYRNREIRTIDGEIYAKSLGLEFIETTSFNYDLVYRVFDKLIKQIDLSEIEEPVDLIPQLKQPQIQNKKRCQCNK